MISYAKKHDHSEKKLDNKNWAGRDSVWGADRMGLWVKLGGKQKLWVAMRGGKRQSLRE